MPREQLVCPASMSRKLDCAIQYIRDSCVYLTNVYMQDKLLYAWTEPTYVGRCCMLRSKTWRANKHRDSMGTRTGKTDVKRYHGPGRYKRGVSPRHVTCKPITDLFRYEQTWPLFLALGERWLGPRLWWTGTTRFFFRRVLSATFLAHACVL